MEKLRLGVEFIFSSYRRTATILLIAAISLAIPITLTFLNEEQDIRQEASQICENVPSDIMLVIDKSGSMDQTLGSQTLLDKAKTAARSFVDVISTDTNNRIGLVSYSSVLRTNLDSQLTANFSNVKQEISDLDASGATCIECAIKKANDEISARGRDNIKNVVILLTDGRANAVILSGSINVPFSIASDVALKRIREGFQQNGTVYFTIGLGNDVQTDFLQQIANLSGGKYFFAPTADDLQSIYTQISQIVGKSSVSGFVYDDANANGALDDGETKLSGWTMNLALKDNSGSPSAVTTDSSGGFSFSGLCSGEYTLTTQEQNGWTITSPQDKKYDVILTNGDSSTEKSFGVQSATLSPSPTNTPVPTPTCTPRPADTTNATEPDGGWCPAPDVTTLNLSVTLVGIGNASNSALGINNNPKRPDRMAEIVIIDSNNAQVASSTGTLTYDNSVGAYVGAIDLGPNIQTGSYLVKTRLDNTLWKTIPGIQSITAGTSNQAPTTQLISGDVNQDNEINILDYNAFLSCYQTGECKITDNPTALGLFDSILSFVRNLFVKDVSAQTWYSRDSNNNLCRQKPSYCDNSWAALLSSCQEPSAGWCTSTPTPTPSSCTAKPSYCNYSWASFLSNCQTPSGGWCTTPTPTSSPTPTAAVQTPVCGDNVCQNVTCQALGCPAPETAQSCPADCQNTTPTVTITTVPESTATTTPTTAVTSTPSNTPAPTVNPEVNNSEKAVFDFDDNGIIDLPDFNILLNSFEERMGD